MIYTNTLFNGYNLDDNLVTQNHPLSSKGLSSFRDIFSTPYYEDNMGYAYGYRPIVHLSFAIENQLFGEHPFVSHLFNLIFYCIAVFLLFKLLSNWVGHNYRFIAFIATVLFAVHPIHSEAVASIKNRDEILAFIFMLLAALSLNKLLKKYSFINLILVGIFFAIGMLAKKSIFPMSILLPIISLSIHPISIKKYFLILLVLSIPSSLIAVDFKLLFSLKLMLLQIFVLIFFFIITLKFNELHIFFQSKIKYIYLGLILMSWALMFCFLYFNNIFYFVLAIFTALIYLFKYNYYGTILLILQFAIVGFVNDVFNFKLLSLFLLLIQNPRFLFQANKDWLIYVLGSIIIVFILILNFSIANILLIGIILFIFYSLQNNILWSIIVSLVALLISILFFNFSVFTLLLLFITIVCFFIHQNYEKIIIKFLQLFSIIFILIYTFINSSNVIFKKTNNNLIVNNNTYLTSTSINLDNEQIQLFKFKEGRNLQFVENTLVKPHSFSETLGTGIITIGTYLKILVIPTELSFYYGYAVINTTSLFSFKSIFYLLIYLIIFLMGIIFYKKYPFILIGYLWYTISILLFSNYVELVAGMVGERLAFNASAGFCLFLAACLFMLKENINFKYKKIYIYLFGLFILLLAVRTVFRNNDWSDSLTLMKNDINHLDQSAQAHNLLALNLMDISTKDISLDSITKKNIQEDALMHFKRATQIYPAFFNAWYDIGRVYISHKDLIQAKASFEKAYSIDTSSLLVLEELVITSFELQLVDDVEKYATIYIKKDKSNVQIHELLSYIMYLNNIKNKALMYAQNGLLFFPDNQNFKIIIENCKSK